MSGRRRSRALKATALVPLAAVSVAWTASMAGIGGPTLASAQQPPASQAPAALPDGTSLPSQAIEAPASVTGEDGTLGTGSADAAQIVSTSSTSGIPSAALAAYQRAETVINAADTTCQIPWQLVAAIGRVESNHGRAGGSVLDDSGLATPGIIGVALDGTSSTALISDTDAGQYDADTAFDRAVGPMQFIPSTWSVVGVDADGDGERNPQDVDDAALAAAVYLCSGEDDLSSEAGQRAAVYRYNHSQSYVDLVLSVMQAYLSGDFTTIPNSAVAAGTLVAQPGPVSRPEGRDTIRQGSTKTKSTDTKKSGPKTPVSTPTPTADPTPTPEPVPSPEPTPKPGPKPSVPVKTPNGPTVEVPALPTTGATPVDQVLTTVEAIAQCTLDGFVDTTPLGGGSRFDQCVTDYTTP